MTMLRLGERISQVYFNKVAILCALSIVKIWLLSKSLLNSLDSLDNELTQLSVELARIANNYTQYALESWQNATVKLITVLKHVFIFSIELWLGTYACLVGKLVEGTADFALDSSKAVVSAVNTTAFVLADTLDSGVSGLLSVINLIVLVFTGKNQSKTYLNTISEAADSLRLMAANSSDEVTKDISRVKEKVPDFTSLQHKSEKFIGTPFDELVKTFNKMNMNTSPTTSTNSTLSSVSPSHKETIAQLQNSAKRASRTVIVIFGVAIILSITAYTTKEYLVHKWRTRKQAHQSKYSNSTTKYKLFHYMTSSYCNYILLASVVLFGTYVGQIFVLNQLEDNGILFSFSDFNITTSSAQETETAINTRWLNNLNATATSLKGSVNDVVDTLNSTIVSPFEGTPFQKPLSTVIYCVVGRKLEKLDRGLTWIAENSQVHLPRINYDSVFRERWVSILNQYRRSLLLELYFAISLICLWLLQLPIGLLIFFRSSTEEAEAEEADDYCYNTRSSSLTIGSPKPLSEQDQKTYGYPLSNYNVYPYHPLSSRRST